MNLQNPVPLAAELVGIGITLNFDSGTGHIEVLSTTGGSPAEKAGLKD